MALASLFSRCLTVDKIHRIWKRAILVLIPKGGIAVHQPKARPIYLLNDVGKFFERILSGRLKAHMNTPTRCYALPGTLVSGTQFGFREGFSTIDALDAVTGFIRDKVRVGKVMLAVSLDIKNAFNSLSWGAIRWVSICCFSLLLSIRSKNFPIIKHQLYQSIKEIERRFLDP